MSILRTAIDVSRIASKSNRSKCDSACQFPIRQTIRSRQRRIKTFHRATNVKGEAVFRIGSSVDCR